MILFAAVLFLAKFAGHQLNRNIMAHSIKDPGLLQDGKLKIDWVRHFMPLLNGLEKEFAEKQPFKGLKIALSVHLEAKTAYLCETLAAGGAEMYVRGSRHRFH